jgi:hypothetical protein
MTYFWLLFFVGWVAYFLRRELIKTKIERLRRQQNNGKYKPAKSSSNTIKDKKKPTTEPNILSETGENNEGTG